MPPTAPIFKESYNNWDPIYESEVEEEEPVPIMNLEELLYQGDEKPEVTLFVNGKEMTFLCDSGACRTTCREPIPGTHAS